VLVAGSPATKCSRLVDPAEAILVQGDPPRFVGRGGRKLEAALDRFGLDAHDLRVLDAGASTGGFTDCLLQRGAAHVVALDVGHGQLHERLRADVRVEVVERTNLRLVEPGVLGTFDAAVADLSFISLTAVMATLVGSVRTGGWLVLLVKPQFEAGRAAVSRGRGVVSDPELWRAALERVVTSAEACGADLRGVIPSPIRGAEGNQEFLVHLRRERGGPPRGSGARDHLLSEALRAATAAGDR
jgi:23S rRNA (cytidine1920-2'-O)/16S rRNA (cytidine1409-2'-O)-methyltransferase